MRVKHVPRSFRSYLREHCLGCPHHGYRACRTVFSATLPRRRYSKPVRPLVPMTRRSWSAEALMISFATDPVTTEDFTLIPSFLPLSAT